MDIEFLESTLLKHRRKRLDILSPSDQELQQARQYFSSTTIRMAKKYRKSSESLFAVDIDINGRGSKSFTSSDEVDMFLLIEKLPERMRCVYERFEGRQDVKFYLDFDASGESFISPEEGYKILEIFLMALREWLEETGHIVEPHKHFRIFDSSVPDKTSFHFVLCGFHLSDNQEALFLLHHILTKIPTTHKKYFDTSVYKNGQLFRLMGCHKICKDNWKQPLNPFTFDGKEYHWDLGGEEGGRLERLRMFQQSLVSGPEFCNSILISEAVKESFCANDLIDINLKQGLVRKEYISDFDVSFTDVERALQLVHEKIFAKGIFAKFTEVKGNIVCFKRIRPAWCVVCKRKHQHENPFATISEIGQVRWNCRRNEEGKTLYLGRVESSINEEQQERDELCAKAHPHNPSRIVKRAIPETLDNVEDYRALAIKLKFQGTERLGKRAIINRLEQYKQNIFNMLTLDGLHELLQMNNISLQPPKDRKRKECLRLLYRLSSGERSAPSLKDGATRWRQKRSVTPQEKFHKRLRQVINSVERRDTDPFLKFPQFDRDKFTITTLPKITTARIPDGVFNFRQVMAVIACTGSGKSYRLFNDFLDKYKANVVKNIVIIVCRRTLAIDVEGRLKDFMADSLSPQDYEGEIDNLEEVMLANGIRVRNYLKKSDEPIRPGESVIISPESIYKLEGLHFDYCSFDESESLVRQMFSPFHKDHYHRNWAVLEHLIKSDSYRVFADAFMSQLTQELINAYLPAGTHLTILHSTYKNYRGRLLRFATKEKIFEMFQNDLQTGHKPFLVSTTSRGVDQIKGLSKDKDGGAGLYINRNHPFPRESCLSQRALACSGLAFNSKLGAGVSIDKPRTLPEGSKWFDRRYVLLTNKYTPPPVDVAQLMERVRDFSDPETFVSLEGVSYNGGFPQSFDEQMEQLQTKIRFDREFLNEAQRRFGPNTILYRRIGTTYKTLPSLDQSNPRIRMWCLVEWQKSLSYNNYLSTWACYMIHQGYKLDARGLPEPDENKIVEFGEKHRGKTFLEIAENDPDYCRWALQTCEFDGHPDFQEFVSYIYLRNGYQRSPHILYGPATVSPSPLSDSKAEITTQLKQVVEDMKTREQETFLNAPIPDEEEMKLLQDKSRESGELSQEDLTKLKKGKLYGYLPEKFIQQESPPQVEELLLACEKDFALRKWALVASYVVKDGASVDYLDKVLDRWDPSRYGPSRLVTPNEVAMLEGSFQILEQMNIGREIFNNGEWEQWKPVSEVHTREFRRWLGTHLERLDVVFGHRNVASSSGGRRGQTTPESLLDEKNGVRVSSKKVNAYLRKIGFTFKAKRMRNGDDRM
jgi:hypothetical protein